MSADNTKRRNNCFNVEWCFAGKCFNELRAGRPQPPVPHYSIWEKEGDKPEKLVSTKLINPMRVTYNGVVWFA